MNILVVDDNRTLAGNIIDCLELAGHCVDYAACAKQCLGLVQTQSFDVIVLDVMMPGMDGFDACRILREELNSQVPVLFLTAKVELQEKVQGFSAGGDDYLTKPFAMEELICRVEALALRGKRLDLGDLSYACFSLNNARAELRVDGQSVSINNVQYQIMRMLLQQAPAVVSRGKLEAHLWADNPPQSDSLKTHIYQLRQRIKGVLGTPGIETIHGRGYRITPLEAS
ncbi:MAG: response regulator transcription factor [Pseudomonadales bacterium]